MGETLDIVPLGGICFGAADDGVSEGPSVLVHYGNGGSYLDRVPAALVFFDDDGIVNHVV